jgi:hypothetical protein
MYVLFLEIATTAERHADLQVFSVESKKAATFTVLFKPPEVGCFSHELQLRVKLNPFEQYRVLITGNQSSDVPSVIIA